MSSYVENEYNKYGVYKIECSDCNTFYVGQKQTNRKIRATQKRITDAVHV